MDSPYAHTPGTSQGLWHKLDEHLEQVAQNLIPTLTKLGQPELARPLGLLHDAGKCLPDFQQYLQDVFAGRVKPPGPPHAPYGALLTGHFGHRNAGLINVLRGHHAGLMDAGDLSIFYRKERDERAIEAVLHYLQTTFPDLQRTQANPALTDRLTTELQTRMLLSALADADYLDTARHRRPDLERRRAEMRRDLTGYRDTYWGVVSNLQKDVSLSPINLIRREILEHAQAAALGPTGIYQLTTPTGGGKTRASLAFALDHAFHRGLERIIVAAPFNSITTQTARNYRALLKGLPVLEHHSSLPPERLPYTARLAAENWDAPVIVTSFVQLLESLHSAHPARVRKLHNLAHSVIVLDEVQAVPVAFIGPVVRMLEQLTQNYGATVLLCTATPPAVQGATPFLEGFAHVTPVVPLGRQQSHFTALKRVTFTRTEAPLPWTTLADQIAAEPQSLTILNTRRDALALLDVLQGATPNPVRHLSTLQCGAHRADVLTEVESRLTATPGRPIHLVSTQVVEAGVDIDFPFVARALGPLPSIIQAAGRCNREFRLGKGRVLIFEPLDGSPLPGGEYRDLIGLTRALLAQPDLLDHLDEPGISEMFYTRAYRRLQTDQHGILREREAQNFATVERLFKLIEDDTIPVHVHYGEGTELLATLPEEPAIEDLRRLSPYAVGVSQRFVDRHLGDLLREIQPGLLVWQGEYDKVAGLRAALVLR